ncbi:MAG: prokaryotic N-methylation site [Gammaproteobacteria bacterium]|nr:MAG: prokaryotic N-methylation site [Gammaproteobacteria bacterium]RLA15762.1 MAG: prokaryotic N-methylation site [Gammaproteobacteria bacterium]RLA17285.1 MAG: prokaryotic N-methylation site [Gammaproteobacteria bacterium]
MKRLQTGFTLIEISIVLVIIGLILGGALKGQELIKTAKVRSTINQLDGVKAAYYAFQDRYRALPGDYNQALVNLPRPPAGTTIRNGNGNGQVASGGEAGQVWAQLGVAGFLTGAFDGGSATANWTCASNRCLTNSFSGPMMLAFGSEARGTGGSSHELWSGGQLPVNVIAEIDRKIDDGLPRSGTFQVGGSLNSGACATATAYRINLASPQQNCGGVIVGL